MSGNLRVSFVLSGDALLAFERAREAMPCWATHWPTSRLGEYFVSLATRAYAIAPPEARRDIGTAVVEVRLPTDAELATRKLLSEMRNLNS